MIILQDTREQIPWDFTVYGLDQEIVTVKTGDYTIKGLEDKLCIERKRSTGELANNIGKKWATFKKELERMDGLDAYIVCEFPMEDIYLFPKKSGIPKSQWKDLRINNKYLIKMIEDIMSNYNIKFIFSSSPEEAQSKVIEILNAYS